jgi:hypothetical protein
MVVALATALAANAALPSPARAQWSTAYESFYLQARHNWTFRNHHQAADRLFNAFDFGHAILYETLWTKPDAPASELEERRYAQLTTRILARPPRLPLEEAAIEVRYARLVPEAKVMFDWAHVLHRQLYDVLADERLDQARKDAEVARLVAYYRSRADLAFSTKPKSMALMQQQPYSLAFRQRYPKFNGLIWAYHWLQVGLYEPLVVGTDATERQAGVRAAVARFWQMLGDPPRSFPHQMPMTAAISPAFAARYPEAAIIFDNLHSMHDVISDILANASVPRDRKRAEILRAARLFRDDTSYVMASEAAWRTMSIEMGIENMGGPAVGFLPALPAPSVSYGAVMTHDDATGRMLAFLSGSAVPGGRHAHGAHDAHVGRDASDTNAVAGGGAGATEATRAIAALVSGLQSALASHDAAGVRQRASTDADLRLDGAPVSPDALVMGAHGLVPVEPATGMTVHVAGDVAWITPLPGPSAAGEAGPRIVFVALTRSDDGWTIRALHLVRPSR